MIVCMTDMDRLYMIILGEKRTSLSGSLWETGLWRWCEANWDIPGLHWYKWEVCR